MTVNNLVHIDKGIPIPPVSELAHFIEPVFQLSGNTRLDIKTFASEDRISDYFDFSIARDPNSLLTHIQRINYYVRRKNAHRAQGALLDLFIVLGPNGTPLRERMMRFATPLLSQETEAFLLANLNRGISDIEPMPDQGFSVLNKGINGMTKLVQQARAEVIEKPDPLQEARDCLEYGQLAEAQCILETAILAQPERKEIHQDLLEIYQYTADKESFYNMFNQLESKQNPFILLWENMANSFNAVATQG